MIASKLVYKGHVTLGVGGAVFAKIKAQALATRPPFDESVPAGHGNEEARWIEPVGCASRCLKDCERISDRRNA